MIVQLDDPHSDVVGDRVIPSPATCVTGVFTNSFVIQAPRARSRVLGIRFHPPGAWALLAHPLDELSDATSDLDTLLGPAAAHLAEQCHDAGSGMERIRRVLDWLRRRLQGQDPPPRLDAVVRHVARAIKDSRGTARIAELRAQAGISAACLTGAFRRQVGVTPKHFARIIRFDRALSLLARPGARLAEVAFRSGYYDQPHMNADFREIARLTPGDYLRASRYPGSQSVEWTGST
jgi:AraC-like DNA-binding protein